MADPITGMLIVAGGARVAQAGVSVLGEQSKERAIDLEHAERSLQYQQKTLQNYELTNKILDTQLSQASTRGVGLGSMSFEAIQRHTTDVGARRLKNLETEESVFEYNERLERQNARMSLAAQLFGDVSSFAMDIIGAKAKMPSGGKA